jgi:AcrR family transcriptional regulator
MTSQKEKSELTKRRLLESGAQLLLEQGYECSTVNAILERAGLSKGAFYHIYNSKDDLFWDLLQEEVTKMREGFWAEANANTDLLYLTEFMVRSSLTLSLDPVFKTIYSYYHSKASHNAEAGQRLISINKIRRELTMETIGNAQTKGHIPEHIDILEISTMVLAMSIGLSMQISADPEKVSFDNYVNMYQDVVLAMFKGHGFSRINNSGDEN